MKYKINEIFHSLQGEGFNTGKPFIFLRLSGCNLSCPWCDTSHEAGEELDLPRIIDKLKPYTCRDILITGGEPTIHNLQELLQSLKQAGYSLTLETNGLVPLNPYRALLDYVTISPKREAREWRLQNKRADEIRVLNDDLCIDDLLQLEKILSGRFYFLSPKEEKGNLNLKETVRLLGEINQRGQREWFLSLQTHKLMGIR